MKNKKRILLPALVAAALCLFATGALAGGRGDGDGAGGGADPKAVPYSASTLALLGVSMLGIVGLRNKFARRNASQD